jgi:exosome complex RNA-binding protein Rrp4
MASSVANKTQSEVLPSVVMPGDVIASSLPMHGIVQLGSGVDISERQPVQNHTHNLIDSNEIPSSGGMRGSRLIATEVGLLVSAGGDNKSKNKSNETPEVLSYSVTAIHKKRYTHPCVGDAVIGTVLSQVGGEYYEIDIHSMTTALLPVLAFDNATKRNRPMLKVGDVVYGSVKVVDGMERILLDCTNSGSSGFGPLYQSMNSARSGGKGMLFRITPSYSQYLLKSSNSSRDSSSILHVLGSRIPFEIVIGMNGVFWLCSSGGDGSGSSGDAFIETCILGATIQACETVVGEAGDALSRRVLGVLAHHMAKKS